ncbi:nucleotidyltransferase and HEPN domain-containing protein [Asticcacaulis sp. EMRT-3]|uniref:nucleotidyltransferase and HEPN domain-containing protein n=1 Tax=Asticcacaulis sp. EMRT-3 TaxID=3040349 RepID=UPI0024AE95BC|nr:nucleotidyltransferase and HEPN domain-containing protein [Asticcacaulis sp. EMRT-3]MDI7774042.1 nucleotidyltransferase and HEPN domain-containing protein [Asticcacaulis sp. EMRT-3]
MLADQLSHLPDTKRRELERVVKVLFDEFEDVTKTKLSDKRKLGRILKVILFGSYARGDWVEDRLSGYRSDYDLLIVVNSHQFTDLHEYWGKADEHFIREVTVTQHIKTPVNFIVHDLADVNDQLAKGRPFFTDIARDGIMLYEAPGHPLIKPKPLTAAEIKAEAQANFDQWFPDAVEFQNIAGYCIERNNLKLAAFNLHQAAERLYHCLLLVLTLYSPKSHRITLLRSQAEALDDRLKAVWPNDTKLHRQAFDRLRRAYVEARYSAEYAVSEDELEWLNERITILRDIVQAVCRERLGT